MKLTTKSTPANQPSITIEVRQEAEELARPIIAYFESRAWAGTRFLDGQTIEFGWSLLLLRQANDGLEVLEPDFDSMPIRWCNGVNNSIRHLQLQRAVCELFGCDSIFPTIRQAGISSPDLCESGDYIMSRDIPSGSDSGWMFAESGYSDSTGEFRSLYQLALQKIEIVPFLALPTLSQVVIKPGFREVVVNSIIKSSVDCELLQKLARA